MDAPPSNAGVQRSTRSLSRRWSILHRPIPSRPKTHSWILSIMLREHWEIQNYLISCLHARAASTTCKDHDGTFTTPAKYPSTGIFISAAAFLLDSCNASEFVLYGRSSGSGTRYLLHQLRCTTTTTCDSCKPPSVKLIGVSYRLT